MKTILNIIVGLTFIMLLPIILPIVLIIMAIEFLITSANSLGETLIDYFKKGK